EAPHRFEKNAWIVMPGQTQEAHFAGIAGLAQCLERSALREDALQIILRPEVMQLPKIEPIRSQPPEAVVQDAQRTIARPIGGLRGEKNLLPPLAKRCAVIVHAARVRRRGITIADSQIESAVDDAHGLVHPAMRPQDAFAPKAK